MQGNHAFRAQLRSRGSSLIFASTQTLSSKRSTVGAQSARAKTSSMHASSQYLMNFGPTLQATKIARRSLVGSVVEAVASWIDILRKK